MAGEAQGPGGANITVVSDIQSRDGTLTTDALMVNGFAEKTDLGPAFVKRAGMVNQALLPAGVAQGMFIWNGNPYAIQADAIWNLQTGAAIAIPGITQANELFTFLSDVPVRTSLLKSPTGLWVFNGTTATKVTDPNYPGITVPGITYLDGTYYVLTQTGQIYGSALQDPTTWPALNFLSVDAALGIGVALARHQNYITAFCAHGTALYWDAGNSPGIPLAPVSNASFRTGCVNGFTVTKLNDTTYFVGRGAEFGRSVWQLTPGIGLQKVSTPAIERILNRSPMTSAFASGVKVNGHSFYFLNILDSLKTIVYDEDTGLWSQWTSQVNGVEQNFVGINHLATDGGFRLFQNVVIGQALNMSETVFSDFSGNILARVDTAPHDWGTMKTKRFPAINLYADSSNATVTVQYTDDDYQTWSTPRTVSLSSFRKQLQRCGRSRRRAWRFVHTDASTSFKLYGYEIEDLSIGPA